MNLAGITGAVILMCTLILQTLLRYLIARSHWGHWGSNLQNSLIYYSGHKESNNLHRDIVILRVLRGAELPSQSASERHIQPAWQSLKLLTRRYLNSGQGNMSDVFPRPDMIKSIFKFYP